MKKIIVPQDQDRFEVNKIGSFPSPAVTYAYVTAGGLIATLSLTYSDSSDQVVAFKYSDDLDNPTRTRLGYDVRVKRRSHLRSVDPIIEAARESVIAAVRAGRSVFRFESRQEYFEWASQNVGH